MFSQFFIFIENTTIENMLSLLLSPYCFEKNCSDHLSVQSTQTLFKSTVQNIVEITFVVFLI